MSADNDLKLETKCYDAMEYGYLYGLNKKIPDEEWEKVKPYMRKWKRMDFVEGNIKVTGRPEGYRCLEEDVPKVEEILGITNTLEKRRKNIENLHINAGLTAIYSQTDLRKFVSKLSVRKPRTRRYDRDGNPIIKKQ